MVPVQGTPKSGSHSNPARGSGENSEVSKALVGHKRGAVSAPGDTHGAKRSTKKYACEFPGCHVAFSRLSNKKANSDPYG